MPTLKTTKGSAQNHLPWLREWLSPIEVEIVLAVDKAATTATAEYKESGKSNIGKHVFSGLDSLATCLGYQQKTNWLYDAIWFIRRKSEWLPSLGFPESVTWQKSNLLWGDFEGLKLICEPD